MSEPVPIHIEILADESERPAMIAGAEQLGEALAAASGGRRWALHLGLRDPWGEPMAQPAPTAVILSLLPEVARLDEPAAETEARWRARLQRLQALDAPVFVCTVFRGLRAGGGPRTDPRTLERIRRLNRLAVTLSHELGALVIDFDRAMAHIGAQALQSGYRPSGVVAAEVGGHTVAWALLSYGLDAVADPALQEQARAALGDLQQIDALVARRLAARRRAGA